jgi:hypothetical protein
MLLSVVHLIILFWLCYCLLFILLFYFGYAIVGCSSYYFILAMLLSVVHLIILFWLCYCRLFILLFYFGYAIVGCSSIYDFWLMPSNFCKHDSKLYNCKLVLRDDIFSWSQSNVIMLHRFVLTHSTILRSRWNSFFVFIVYKNCKQANKKIIIVLMLFFH